MNSTSQSVCDLSIILPTYNERDHIAELLRSICCSVKPLTASFEIVVVDDSSPDGTAAEAARVDECHVVVWVRQGERGLASAVRYGVEHSAGTTLVIMDADFNHHPEDIPCLLAALDTADVAVGSRYVPGGGMPRPRWRHWSSWLLNRWIRLRTRSCVGDNTSGFLAFRQSLRRHLDFDRVFLGYGDYCIRLLAQFQRQGWRIAEVPVVYGTRKSGSSKTLVLGFLPQYLRTVEQIRARQP